ncbi:swi5-like zinc finger protein [Coemansia sp. RSA 1813]|nr:swi5-like zinc finger protein [Coemansia sp. RSA 1646]KAJ1767113.1 swi5-like zinc finger protein [Coemansia sp. RSA 1843]KAJ2215275.1 swi5-like zinc finger protein [Coemansia sp. RSA 487]KAJ2570971.1 swi5-like zinc finger protein [Coemansia sp. RSA 1813]
MDASPSKRSRKATRQTGEAVQSDNLTNLTSSLMSKEIPADKDNTPLFTLEDEKNKELDESISALRRELDTLAKKKEALLSEEDMSLEKAHLMNDEHIDRLHRYNDIKDSGQILFGKLAELKGKTVKEIYEEYGVNLKD